MVRWRPSGVSASPLAGAGGKVDVEACIDVILTMRCVERSGRNASDGGTREQVSMLSSSKQSDDDMQGQVSMLRRSQ